MKKTWITARKAVTCISGAGCLTIGICLIAQIFCRTFFGISLSWSEEIAQCGMIFMVFLALAEVEANNEHLTVEVLFSIFPKLARPMTIIGTVLTIAYSAIIIYSGTLMLPYIQKTLAKASKFPIRFLYYAIIVGTAFWMIQCVINLVSAIKDRGNET